MRLGTDIVVASGLPRSGTSLMMQMLECGGLPVVTDGCRRAEPDNPRGYFEFEPVKRTKQDPSWLPRARGKGVKIVSSLLYDLPDSERYRVIFMQRDLEEVLESQERMLRRRERTSLPREQLRIAFQIHLSRISAVLAWHEQMTSLEISYNEVVRDPAASLRRISEFLDCAVDPSRMQEVIDTSLYRNQNPTGVTSTRRLAVANFCET